MFPRIASRPVADRIVVGNKTTVDNRAAVGSMKGLNNQFLGDNKKRVNRQAGKKNPQPDNKFDRRSSWRQQLSQNLH